MKEENAKEDALRLMEKYSKMDSIWENFFDTPAKGRKNSPMVIKFVNPEL